MKKKRKEKRAKNKSSYSFKIPGKFPSKFEKKSRTWVAKKFLSYIFLGYFSFFFFLFTFIQIFNSFQKFIHLMVQMKKTWVKWISFDAKYSFIFFFFTALSEERSNALMRLPYWSLQSPQSLQFSNNCYSDSVEKKLNKK